MILVFILLFLSVLVDDGGHETLANFGYIISGICAVLWVAATIAHAASEPDEDTT